MELQKIQQLHGRAVQVSVAAVDRVGLDQLTRPTPCAGWTIADLLAHMIVQNLGFAAAARGENADDSTSEPRPLGADPVAEHRAAAKRVQEAFAEDGVLDRGLRLPEISRTHPIPGAMAITFHLVDCVVHAWDVARALGEQIELDDELAAIAVEIAAAVPGGEQRLGPAAAFKPRLTGESGASQVDRVVSLLGRSPNWPD